MRVYVLMFFAGLLASFPGFAAAEDSGDFKIRVIQEDGSVQEVDVRKPAPAPSPEPQKVAPRQPPPQQEARVPRVRDSDLVQPSEIEPSWVERNIAPAEPSAPADEEEYEPRRSVKAAYAPAAAQASARIPPLPPRKPSAAPAAPGPGTISADLAANIALDNAPASHGFKIHEDVYAGRHVFAVVFVTDTGPFEVLVDSANGDVVYKGDLAAAQPAQATGSKWPVARR